MVRPRLPTPGGERFLVRRVQVDLHPRTDGHPVLVVGRVVVDPTIRIRIRRRSIFDGLVLRVAVFSDLVMCTT